MTKDSQTLTTREPQEMTDAGNAEMAVTVREPSQPLTAAQAKIDAVAALTLSAYQRASQLTLTDTEIAALTAPFPDEAFKPGAAGKENLIYIEHAFLRDRLNNVFRPGSWSIVPRNRWAEPFVTAKGVDGSRIYVEAMLCIRGCFAAEAIGEMEYYPSNGSQNYGDAVEGAKSAALRRCCKEIGIGLEAWKKDWCDGWWQRRRGAAPKAIPRQTPAPAKAVDVLPKAATETTRTWMLTALKPYGDELLLEYAQKNSILLPTEALTDWPLHTVPTSQQALRNLMLKVETFRDGGAPPDPQAEAWRQFPMPFGKHAGVKMEDLEKKYLFGLWCNYEVETEYNGKPKKPETIERDELFREMLDAAGEHYGFTKPD